MPAPASLVDDEVPRARPSAAPERRSGVVASVSTGMAGPLGGSTVTPSWSEGLGVAATLGLAFDPLSMHVFGQYVRSAIAYDPSIEGPVTSDADVWLAGGEIRASVGDEVVLGWLSFGLAIGGGAASASGPNVVRPIDYELTLGATPVLGLGAEMQLGKRFAIGPSLRWYATNVSRVCRVETAESGARDADCENDPASDQIGPDVLFLGVTFTLYPSRES